MQWLFNWSRAFAVSQFLLATSDDDRLGESHSAAQIDLPRTENCLNYFECAWQTCRFPFGFHINISIYVDEATKTFLIFSHRATREAGKNFSLISVSPKFSVCFSLSSSRWQLMKCCACVNECGSFRAPLCTFVDFRLRSLTRFVWGFLAVFHWSSTANELWKRSQGGWRRGSLNPNCPLNLPA
jgi:hypothetical protein